MALTGIIITFVIFVDRYCSRTDTKKVEDDSMFDKAKVGKEKMDKIANRTESHLTKRLTTR